MPDCRETNATDFCYPGDIENIETYNYVTKFLLVIVSYTLDNRENCLIDRKNI